MSGQDQLRKYQELEVKTSSPERLVLLLYDGAIRFLNEAKRKIEEKNWEESNKLLIKGQRIISELMTSLDLEVADFTRGWYSLYDYMHQRLIEANLKKDAEPVEEVLQLIIPLRDSWAQIMSSNQGGRNADNH